MRNKGTRFGYKTFVLTSSDGYPYHIIPYSGAKGLAGTPGKDLTSRVVIDFLTEFKDVKPNLAFDNWYTSTKLLSIQSGNLKSREKKMDKNIYICTIEHVIRTLHWICKTTTDIEIFIYVI